MAASAGQLDGALQILEAARAEFGGSRMDLAQVQYDAPDDAEEGFMAEASGLEVNALETFTFEGYGRALVQSHCDMWRSGKLADVTVRCRDHDNPASRLILSSDSKYLRTLLQSEPFRDDAHPVVDLGDLVEPDAVERVIEAMYTRSLVVTTRNVRSLLAVAQLLQVDTVRTACATFLRRLLTVSNSLYMLWLAESYSIQDLLSPDLDVMVIEQALADPVNLSSLPHRAWFISLPGEFLINLLRKDPLALASELALLEVILAWVKVDVPSRLDYLPELMAAVRLASIPATTLAARVYGEDVLKGNPPCLMLVIDALLHMHQPNCRDALELRYGWHPRASRVGQTLRHVRFKASTKFVRPVYSEPFDGGRWRVLVRARAVQSKDKSAASQLSVYLNVADSHALPPNWKRTVERCTFTFVNHHDPRATIAKDMSHTFSSQDLSWGFVDFCPLRDVVSPAGGFLQSDVLEFLVDIQTSR
eukprot:jgi/Chlat1/2697/Chrsp180S02861